jgi:RHS repeat-associated protein
VSYDYNLAGQRTNLQVGGTSSTSPHSWAFGYDNLGQVTSGKNYWPDGTPVAGQQFEYTFDDIGNRRQTKAGGNESGAGLRPAQYTNNLLNQITFRDVPGTNDITGIAHASATVTVNGQSVYRKGEYFWKELAATNSAAVAWEPVTNQATLGNETNTQIGCLLTPKRVQQFWYDADGNLLSDGLWTNTWDAENRIITTESGPGVSTGAKAKEAWSYYPDGRWQNRVLYSWTNSQYQAASTNRFVWDGLHLAAVLDHTNGLLQAFIRGLDLSASLQGAGAAGGLLALVTATTGNHFYAFDGNGNVVALVAATNGTETARYEYGPFGELMRKTGPMASLNSFRLASRYQANQTGLLYYDGRPYDPTLGRWLTSGQPDGEESANPRSFFENCPDSSVGPGKDTRIAFQGQRSQPATPRPTPVSPSGQTAIQLTASLGATHRGFCGEYWWEIAWRIGPATANTKGGWVIQEVNISWDVYDRRGLSVEPISAKGKKNPQHYWEAWYIPANTDRPQNTRWTPYGNAPDIDRFSWGEEPCTQGAVYWGASAVFYHGLSPHAVTSQMQLGNPDTMAGGLWSTTDNPNQNSSVFSGKTPSSSYAHALSISWDCTSERTPTRVGVRFAGGAYLEPAM